MDCGSELCAMFSRYFKQPAIYVAGMPGNSSSHMLAALTTAPSKRGGATADKDAGSLTTRLAFHYCKSLHIYYSPTVWGFLIQAGN